MSKRYPRAPVDVRPRLHARPADGAVPGMPGWRWLHTPGHTRGHVSLWREADRAVIAGDAFITTEQESAKHAGLGRGRRVRAPSSRREACGGAAGGGIIARVAGLLTSSHTPMRATIRRRLLLALTAVAAPVAACRAPARASGPVAAVPPAPARVELVAHRGESADAPENTLAAFRLAWQRGVPAIELDVHLTRDGQLVVSHDANTRRTTGVARVIKESTLEELRGLDAGRWKGAQWAGERLPTLEEALATVPAGARCLIEVKVGAEAIPALVEAVRRSGKTPAQLAVISFQLDAVAEAKRRLPEIPAYYLSSFRRDSTTGAWTPTIDELIARARGARLDGLDLAFTGPLDAEAARRIRAAGLALHVWTVDDPAVARRLIGYGVDGITTNRAAALRAELGIR